MLRELHLRLRNNFDLAKPFVRLDQDVVCYTYPFTSDMSDKLKLEEEKDLTKGASVFYPLENKENRRFRYAVFVPVNRDSDNEAIVLLHGLNERSWEKYLTWAYSLAVYSRSPVILFPLANHINRSPQAWRMPRQMREVLDQRRQSFGKIRNSSFANAALSDRIDRKPELFISSGIQSIVDIVKLTYEIISGEHPLFKKNARVNFFSYSIGAFVTEILLMANPHNLYTSSKAFFFCGGATFDQMDGRSKSILDNRAFDSLKQYIGRAEISKTTMAILDALNPFGHSVLSAFWALASLDNLKQRHKNALDLMRQKIRGIGLKIDKVIPGDAICNTLCFENGNNGQILNADFKYEYSHEVPFPVDKYVDINEVDHSFHFVFKSAADFFRANR